MEELASLGLISREAALKKVIEPNLVDYRVQDGSLVPIYRGIYRFRGAPDSWHSRALALAMYGGKGSAISHVAAAYLHGLEGFKEPNDLDLLVPAGVKVRPAGARVHRTREPFQIYKCNDVIPTTSLARTLIDLAPHVTELQLEIALNSAWRKQRTIARWLLTCFNQLKRNDLRNLKPLIQLVHQLDGKGGLDSALEVRTTRKIATVDLPAPTRGLIILDNFGKHLIKADLGWKDRKVVAHVDGFAFHRPELAMVRDARQRSELALLGWTQIIVMHRSFEEGIWLEQLRRALLR